MTRRAPGWPGTSGLVLVSSGGVQRELEMLMKPLDRREQALFGRTSEKRRVVTPESAPATPPASLPRHWHGPTRQPRLPDIETWVELPKVERGCPPCGGQL
ncbi:MAG TPA: hypothetical protein P5234_11840 [Thermoanaerobaculaceae bacterium]|nr:hypothetical protein [Thermoanaerobaculaceae bacterium]HRS16923.1 hypothetical protein [Thermoanaerobaculaceae bacterium]